MGGVESNLEEKTGKATSQSSSKTWIFGAFILEMANCRLEDATETH